MGKTSFTHRGHGFTLCIAVLAVHLILLACQVLHVDALTPVQDTTGSYVLAPAQASLPVWLDKTSLHVLGDPKGGKVAPKRPSSPAPKAPPSVENSQSPAKKNRAEKTDLQPRPGVVDSFWVKSLDFAYHGKTLVSDTFHNQLSQITSDDPKKNYVLAQLTAVYKDGNNHKPAKLGFLKDMCFNNGKENSYIKLNGGQQVCQGVKAAGGDTFDHIVRLQIGEDKSTCNHCHSEQGFLAYLYNDADNCLKHGLKHGKCQLGQHGPFAKDDQRCLVEMLVLDLISYPNTVCPQCNEALSQARFLDGYQRALNRPDVCPNSPPLKLLIRTSADRLYVQNSPISCQHVDGNNVNQLHTTISTGTSVIMHKLPRTVPAGVKFVSKDCEGKKLPSST